MPEINTLLTGSDNIEVARDQIGAILLTEFKNQRALAVAQSIDPAPWDVRIFVERAGQFEAAIANLPQSRPMVNVWIDNATYDESASNVMERQKATAFINVDAVGFGVTRPGQGGGQDPADYRAAIECQRVSRLCRQILMAAPYTYLGLRGLVWRRRQQSLIYYQPSIGDRPVMGAYGGRMTLAVDFSEFSPQTGAEQLEYVSIAVNRAETGELYLQADYDYTKGGNP